MALYHSDLCFCCYIFSDSRASLCLITLLVVALFPTNNPGSFPHYKILNLITPTKSLLSTKGTETQVLGLGASLFGGYPAAPELPTTPPAHPFRAHTPPPSHGGVLTRP